eukprot:CAMPEP_0172386000 /NCGR_PEP_ID=MMETSP1061-20121228/3606_1 /TAXON_ID=37318 /ORGANISM="Pseudo-nitzschia pungens, Strain cf. pungens" /LENGTH=291 /DNA_ID=CAMNT_0013115223 /DNA_START=52 /DNA_END=927 /DNA_ORIENTATION=-
MVLLSFSRQPHTHVDCFQMPKDGKQQQQQQQRQPRQQQQQQQFHNPKHLKNRRNVLASIPQLASVVLLDPRKHQRDANALALPFFDQQQDRIQKELCLVNLLRLQSWASSLSEKLTTLGETQDDEDKKKTLYLEARLGSKVMVAESKKISGGANANVFMLKGLHIRECLDDLTYYYYIDNKNNKNKNKNNNNKGSKKRTQTMDRYREDLIESLASIVEFDGLETTQDPSPRSSLTLTMYNPQKGLFVQRMLAERIVPLIDDIVSLFDPDTRAQSEYYMREYYPSEVMVKKS